MFTAGVTLQVWRVPAPGAVATRLVAADEDGWALAPPETLRSAAEEGVNPPVIRERLNGYRQSASALLSSDEVEWGNGRFKLVGPAANWPDPWDGGVVGAVVLLERVAVDAPGWVFDRQVSVETRLGSSGYGPVYAPPAPLACVLNDVAEAVTRLDTGSEFQVTAQLTCAAVDADRVVPGSRVTLADGHRVVVLTRTVTDPQDRAMSGLTAVVCELGLRRTPSGNAG